MRKLIHILLNVVLCLCSNKIRFYAFTKPSFSIRLNFKIKDFFPLQYRSIMIGRDLLHGVHFNDYQSQSFLVESALVPELELKL